MKTILFLAILSLPLQAEPISIKDTKGREIIASVIAVWPDAITVKKSDNSEHVIKFTDLSPASLETIRSAAEAEKPKPLSGIIVTHLITKLVEGKFRYFFDVRNYESKPWAGSATITLLNTQPGVKNGEIIFSTPFAIETNKGFSRFVEVNTGPASVHGDWSVAGFSYAIKDPTGKDLYSGKGFLTPKTEGF